MWGVQVIIIIIIIIIIILRLLPFVLTGFTNQKVKNSHIFHLIFRSNLRT